jgi:hypothetical protein
MLLATCLSAKLSTSGFSSAGGCCAEQQRVVDLLQPGAGDQLAR